MNEPQKRRKVTDDEFRRAYYGIPGDDKSLRDAVDNRNIIKAILHTYRGSIPRQDLESLGMLAMWRCLQYHDPSRPSLADPSKPCNQKLTTSLHRFVQWECQRELKKIRNRQRRQAKHGCKEFSWENMDIVTRRGLDKSRQEEKAHIVECIDLLPHDWQRQVVRQYYLEGLTMAEIGLANGYSKEAARQKISKAVAALKDVCLTQDGVFIFAGEEEWQTPRSIPIRDHRKEPLSATA